MSKQFEPYIVKKAPFIHDLSRLVYTCLFIILLPVMLIVFRKKLMTSSTLLKERKFSERFAILPNHIKSSLKTGGIHIHCVSVGEVNAASGLVKSLLNDHSELPITITTSSITGAEHAYRLFEDRVQHLYLPFDLPFLMQKFYKMLKPRLVMVTEVEIWPNMLSCCVKNNIPCMLINARMSTKSLQSYRRVSFLFRHSLRQFSSICAQSSASFENFLAYGVYKKQLKLSRNMKFDLLPEQSDADKGYALSSRFEIADRPILLAGSTHDPEEHMLLKTYQELKQEHPTLVLIIVPRHPHRFEEAFQIMAAAGLNTVKVSDIASFSNQDRRNKEVDCVLVNEMGWLKACYSICSVAFVGGSFAPKGGHNALEAALYSKPIVMGPSIYNNPTICAYLQEQNALQIVQNQQALRSCIDNWLQHQDEALLAGEKGIRVLLKNAGAVEYTMSIVRRFL
jgi:3-deoxy-D-manno-octulosonic-acid transferase